MEKFQSLVISFALLLTSTEMTFGQQGRSLAKIRIDENGNVAVLEAYAKNTPENDDGLRQTSNRSITDDRAILQRSDEAAEMNPGPDLTYITGSNTNFSYSDPNLTINVYVANYGNTMAGGFSLGYFLSEDRPIEPSDYLLGTDYVSFLQPFPTGGSQQTITVDLTTLSGLPAGGYYVGFIIDLYNNVTEDDEGNNRYSWIQPTVTHRLPDLIVQDLSIELLNITIPTINWCLVLKNQGDREASNIRSKIYLSTDTDITTDDYRINTHTYYGTLGAGDTYEIRAGGMFRVLADGEYYLGAIVDPDGEINENNEENNTGYDADDMVVFMPDLVGTVLLTDAEGPSISWEYTVTNQGGAPASSFNLAFYLSETSDWETSNHHWCRSEYISSGLPPGESYSNTVSNAITRLSPPGDYYFFIIIDSGSWILESNEENNLSYDASHLVHVPPYIDLHVEDLRVNNIEYQNLEFKAELSNLGNIPTPGNMLIRYYLSENQNIESGTDFIVYSYLYPDSVPAFGIFYVPNTVISISGVPPGEYYFGVYIDPENDISESREDNNSAYWWNQVSVPEPLIDVPAAPILDSPAHSATDVSINPTLDWHAGSGSPVEKYQLIVTRQSGGSVYDSSSLTSSKQQIGPLDYSTSYNWKVRAYNSSGWGPYSSTYSFATQSDSIPSTDVPAAPVLDSPANGTADVSLHPTLDWHAGSGSPVEKYQLIVKRQSGESIYNNSSLTSSKQQIGPLDYSTS
ncbi:MAG: hypothetical protein JXR49_08880, partial [Acidobacteria bacterium]|nr:hypothetical protein [Acidobacteriota bacterium]